MTNQGVDGRTVFLDREDRANTDRAALQAGLEDTRACFHGLLESVSGAAWRQKSPGSAWSTAEVFMHLIWALEYLPQEVARARQGRGMFNWPKWLADPLSYWYIRRVARNSTPQSIRQ